MTSLVKTVEEIWGDSITLLVACAQWGDSGKGKVIDYVSISADIIAKGLGAHQAGNTVVDDSGRRTAYHLFPPGTLRARDGKKIVLGNGVAINLDVFFSELNDYFGDNIPYDNLLVSESAKVILPFHVVRDQMENQSQLNGGVGSTGYGVGPCYVDDADRKGIRISDIFNNDLLRTKLKKLQELTYQPKGIDVDIDKIISDIESVRDRIRPMVRDTSEYLLDAMDAGKRILISGCHGALLDGEMGTYPHNTASHPTPAGYAVSLNIPPDRIDQTLMVVKFPFMTRVGGGSFPTEIGGKESRELCATSASDLRTSLLKYEIPFISKVNDTGKPKIEYDHQDPKIFMMINGSDEVARSVGLRLIGDEYGASTGRARRVGYFDAEAARYVARRFPENTRVAFTKVDGARGVWEYKVAYGYEGGSFVPNSHELDKRTPIYKTYAGFSDDISEVRRFEDLPGTLQKSITEVSEFIEREPLLVGVGQQTTKMAVK